MHYDKIRGMHHRNFRTVVVNGKYICDMSFISCILTGGTSVTGALECPSHEKRMIISLDTSQMVCVQFNG